MSEREQFEKWITLPPFEKSIKRNSERGSWPGQYQNIDVQLAWEAWQGRADIAEQSICELESLLRQALDVLENHEGNYKLGRHATQYVLDLMIALRKQLKEPPR